jgi:hypothetical protein
MNNNGAFRSVLESTFGVHKNATLPKFHSKPLRKRITADDGAGAEPAGPLRVRSLCLLPVTATKTTHNPVKT